MRTYLIRRLLLLIPTLLLLTIFVFLLVRFIPGDVIDVMERDIDPWSGQGGAVLDREGVERHLGLDVPMYVQYGRWIGVLPAPDLSTGESRFRGLLQGTLGTSLYYGFTIEEGILDRLPVTIELGALALIIGWSIAFPVGIYSAIRQDTPADYVGRTAAVIGMALPNFWLAIMVMIFPAIWWGWAPPMEWVSFTEDPLGNIALLIIPSVILGTAGAAGIMRLTRTMMLEVLRQDYIRTAWSKGLKERVVVIRHALRNVLIPIVTATGMILPALIGGSVIMENIFNLPGLGRLFVDALGKRDYPMVSAINLIMSSMVMINILIIDISYAWLDPRIRYS